MTALLNLVTSYGKHIAILIWITVGCTQCADVDERLTQEQGIALVEPSPAVSRRQRAVAAAIHDACSPAGEGP